MDDAIKKLQALLADCMREREAKTERVERLKTEIAELERREAGYKLALEGLEAPVPSGPLPPAGGRVSTRELRPIVERLIADKPFGMHHSELRRALQSEGCDAFEERQVRGLLYGLERQWPDRFQVRRGYIVLKASQTLGKPAVSGEEETN